MIEKNETYKMGLPDMFKLSKSTLLRMKCQIKYENLDYGLIVAFIESLTSYPSGELIFVKLFKDGNASSKVIFSSESMAVNSRLFKKKINQKNVDTFFRLFESNLSSMK